MSNHMTIYMNRCKSCHFYNPEYNTLGEPYRNPCVEIPSDGWDYWQSNSKEPEHCNSFVKAGTYKPTGAWAGLAKVVENLQEEIINETPR